MADDAVDTTSEDDANLELVHSRYLGQTPVVMPDLATRERCCDSDNNREEARAKWEAEGREGPDPAVLLVEGDVILLPHDEAEGREDFEVIALHHASPQKSSTSSSSSRSSTESRTVQGKTEAASQSTASQPASESAPEIDKE